MKTSADPVCINYIFEIDPANRLKILYFSSSEVTALQYAEQHWSH
jgi:hypothetical protein